MKPAPTLALAIGLASKAGRRPDNQDFVIACEGSAEERVTHGAVAALADGVGGAKGGRVAAELACRSFVDAYYALPPTLGVAVAADRALAGFNRWLHGMGQADPEMAGAATTFTALVLRGRRAHVLHIGDSRAWQLRGDDLAPLTEDHALPQPENRHILYRAIGLEPTVRLDHGVHAIELHDRLLLTSDGVHDTLSAEAFAALLRRRGPPDRDAEAIVEMAIAAGSPDNVSAIVIDVPALPDPDQAGLAALAADLAIGPLPAVGESIDGYRLERLLANGEQARSFVARRAGGMRVVLKFPEVGAIGEAKAREAFVRERLIGARASSPYLAEIVEPPPGAQSRLYTLMPFYEGETLEARLKRGPLELADGLDVAVKLARGVAALHRIGVVHRDIKPENVLVDGKGGLRLVDFGFARIPGLDEGGASEVPGSQGYIAPEIYRGATPGDEASDQYALGVTLYRIFTGRFPFADLASFHRPGLDSPADPVRFRPDMPAWLALALRRAVQVDPADRFGDVVELGHVLETGSARGVPRPRPAPLLKRDPVGLWQLIALVLLIALTVSLAVR